MTNIFISYRRDDAAGFAGRLYDRLAQHFGEARIFMDISDIPPGVDFRQVINDAVGSCGALIVVIGRQWVTITDHEGQRRLDDPRDFVRLEIAAALERDIPVIPALVDGARMPSEDDLPESIRDLVWRNAVDLTHAHFDDDVVRLIEWLERLLPGDDESAARTPLREKERLPFEPETVLVPAGPFLMGSDPARDPEARDNEWPQHTVTLPEYRIGKYPVTVGEYRVFIDAGGYYERRYWTEAGWQQKEVEGWSTPLDWDDPKLTANWLPVGVGWYEAHAYCQWLAEVTGRPYRLPTEAEWEKAARGTDGRIYPWGDDWRKGMCNTFEASIGHLTPVGQFSPAGDSPYGVADMVGNLDQWCQSKWRDSYREQADNDAAGDADRVLRGVSFVNCGRLYGRCASRSAYPPHIDREFGFRVVCAPLPAP